MSWKCPIPQELADFSAHVLHAVTQFEMADRDLWEVVQDLRTKAIQHGLIASYGQTEIEWIIGSAFADAGVHYGDIRPLEGVYP